MSDKIQKVLVTGAAGYIGSVLVRFLLEKGYSVIGFDALFFGGESLLGVYNHPNFKFVKGDIRNENDFKELLNQVDSVVHLAAIVGDPACAKQPDLAAEINWTATKNLFDLASNSKNIKRFVFASTCSNYGKMEGDGYVNEDSPLRPVSLYAELKVKFEKYLLESDTRDDFIPTSLRFSTVYGLSPRMRFDLTVNEFIREVTFGRELVIFGEQFWRPYCHVEDLALSCIKVLESSPEKVDHNVFNVGDTKENYQKKMIADEILKIVPDAKIKYVQKQEDPRDYRVDFTKISNELGFKITKTVPQGLREIYEILKYGILTDPFSDKYKNV
ncbi:MAG: NAD(P)-dependent oxidoreductase [Candidatus Woesearchaeota archaeon]